MSVNIVRGKTLVAKLPGRVYPESSLPPEIVHVDSKLECIGRKNESSLGALGFFLAVSGNLAGKRVYIPLKNIFDWASMEF